jgi:hypothetical protein
MNDRRKRDNGNGTGIGSGAGTRSRGEADFENATVTEDIGTDRRIEGGDRDAEIRDTSAQASGIEYGSTETADRAAQQGEAATTAATGRRPRGRPRKNRETVEAVERPMVVDIDELTVDEPKPKRRRKTNDIIDKEVIQSLIATVFWFNGMFKPEPLRQAWLVEPSNFEHSSTAIQRRLENLPPDRQQKVMPILDIATIAIEIGGAFLVCVQRENEIRAQLAIQQRGASASANPTQQNDNTNHARADDRQDSSVVHQILRI